MANLNLSQEKLQALRSEYKHRNVKGKYPRQKMLPEYRALYPWVLPDEVDPYFAFCTICECRLSAKRSDLGKHEGSIKHTENAAKKVLDGVILKGCRQASTDENMPGSDRGCYPQGVADEETDEEAPYIKQEPMLDLVETSSSALNVEELNQEGPDTVHLHSPEDANDDTERVENEAELEDEEDEYEEEDDDDVKYVPPSKRRCSESDSQSQHSSTPDFLPLHVTINEAATVQRFSIREIPAIGTYATGAAVMNPQNVATSAMHYTPHAAAIMNTPQTPCKITIKKITHPLTTSTLAQVTTTATITPVVAPITISQQSHQAPKVSALQTQSCTPTTAALAPQAAPMAAHVARDHFELFFDSICASVKGLPPKLATEGKIRVMQLIGELEMRAITEKEREQDGAASGSSVGGVSQGGQQNSTVASTTK